MLDNVCVISAGFPRKVLQQSPQLVRFRRVRSVLWKAEMELPFYVLVCSELEVTPRNYPFLLFAAGRKRREFLQALVQEAGSPYLPLALELYSQTVMEEYLMSRKSTQREEELRNAAEMIMPLLSPESFAAVVEEFLISRQSTGREQELRNALDLIGPEMIGRLLSPESFSAIAAERLGSGGSTNREEYLRSFIDQIGTVRGVK